jgi:DNA-directed RNA polymerase specialized sigma24 family protein
MLEALKGATIARRWRAWYALEVEGYTAEEIAAMEGVSAAVVSHRIRGARDDFAKVLGQPAPTFRTRGDR